MGKDIRGWLALLIFAAVCFVVGYFRLMNINLWLALAAFALGSTVIWFLMESGEGEDVSSKIDDGPDETEMMKQREHHAK